jgi:hypothetical protein
MIDRRSSNLGLTLLLLVWLAACNNDGPAAQFNGDGASARPAADPEPDAGASAMAEQPALREQRQPAAPCAQGAAADGGTCKISGSYAVQVELDVWWLDELDERAPLFDPGRGKLRLLAQSTLSEFCQDGSGSALMQTCALRLPPIYNDDNGGVLQLILPDALWDRPGMPVANAAADAHAFAQTAAISFEPVVSTIGITLANLAAPWPSYAQTPFVPCGDGQQGSACFPDQDGDGHPGITARVQMRGDAPTPGYAHRGGWQYAAAGSDPDQLLLDAGAVAIYLGLRTTLSGSQPLGTDCQGAAGALNAGDVSLRALDCAMRDGTPCTAAGATFVDRRMPTFHVLQPGETPPTRWKHPRRDADAQLDRSPSLGPQSTTVRLGELADNLGCADARAAFASDVVAQAE